MKYQPGGTSRTATLWLYQWRNPVARLPYLLIYLGMLPFGRRPKGETSKVVSVSST